MDNMEPLRRPSLNDGRWRPHGDYGVVNPRQSRRHAYPPGYLNLMAQLYNEQINYFSRHSQMASYHHLTVMNWRSHDNEFLAYQNPNYRINRNFPDYRRYRRYNDESRYMDVPRCRGQQNQRDRENWRANFENIVDDSMLADHPLQEPADVQRGRKIRPSSWKSNDQDALKDQCKKDKSDEVSNQLNLVGPKGTSSEFHTFEIRERRKAQGTNEADFSCLPLSEINKTASMDDALESANWNWFSQEEQQLIVNTLKEIDVRHEQQMLKDRLLNNKKLLFKTPTHSPSATSESNYKTTVDIDSEFNNKTNLYENHYQEDDGEETIDLEESSSDDGIVILLPSSSPPIDVVTEAAPHTSEIPKTVNPAEEIANNWGKFCRGWDQAISDTSSSKPSSPSISMASCCPSRSRRSNHRYNETLTNDLKKLLGIRSIGAYSGSHFYKDLTSDEEVELYKASMIAEMPDCNFVDDRIYRDRERTKRSSSKFNDEYQSTPNCLHPHKSQKKGKCKGRREISPSALNKKPIRYLNSRAISNSQTLNNYTSTPVSSGESFVVKTSLSSNGIQLEVRCSNPPITEVKTTMQSNNAEASAYLKKILGVDSPKNNQTPGDYLTFVENLQLDEKEQATKSGLKNVLAISQKEQENLRFPVSLDSKNQNDGVASLIPPLKDTTLDEKPSNLSIEKKCQPTKEYQVNQSSSETVNVQKQMLTEASHKPDAFLTTVTSENTEKKKKKKCKKARKKKKTTEASKADNEILTTEELIKSQEKHISEDVNNNNKKKLTLENQKMPSNKLDPNSTKNKWPNSKTKFPELTNRLKVTVKVTNTNADLKSVSLETIAENCQSKFRQNNYSQESSTNKPQTIPKPKEDHNNKERFRKRSYQGGKTTNAKQNDNIKDVSTQEKCRTEEKKNCLKELPTEEKCKINGKKDTSMTAQERGKFKGKKERSKAVAAQEAREIDGKQEKNHTVKKNPTSKGRIETTMQNADNQPKLTKPNPPNHPKSLLEAKARVKTITSRTRLLEERGCSLPQKENKSLCVNKNMFEKSNNLLDNGKFGTLKFRKTNINHQRIDRHHNPSDSDLLKSFNRQHLWCYKRKTINSEIDASSFYLSLDVADKSIVKSRSTSCLGKGSFGARVK